MDGNIKAAGCENTKLATACVPFQIMNQVFTKKEALEKGTLFPELYKPCWDVYVGKNRGQCDE